jgi:hypothetical protein
MFEYLKKAVNEQMEAERKESQHFIAAGFKDHWNKENQNDSDKGIKAYLTETRWKQYQDGTITRRQAVNFANNRMEKQIAKKQEQEYKLLEAAENAPELYYISICVSYSNYGSASAEVRTNYGTHYGKACGYGYDKQSAAIAEAMNQDAAIMKVLYQLKENALAAGISDHSSTAITGVNNKSVCGYGAGYNTIPYFEGGCGSSCYWSILKKCGFNTSEHFGKHDDFFEVKKEGL